MPCDEDTHILQDYFTSNGTILRIPNRQWIKPKLCWKITQHITHQIMCVSIHISKTIWYSPIKQSNAHNAAMAKLKHMSDFQCIKVTDVLSIQVTLHMLNDCNEFAPCHNETHMHYIICIGQTEYLETCQLKWSQRMIIVYTANTWCFQRSDYISHLWM